MRIVLLTPRRRFIANRFGVGYQVPLNLVFLGGPLVDAGHSVRLIDNDFLGWDDGRLARELAAESPDCILMGHTGSTAAHPAAMATARVLRESLPETLLVYGGVYPSYSARTVLLENPAIDVIVRGEGEETAVELAAALESGRSLEDIRGITWRGPDGIRENPNRPPILNLDRFRPGWELVDWDAYRLFGHRRAAGMQFSRGCPLRCTYCGQWGFWRRWRHRSPRNFVGELETLARRYGVTFVWLADENFAADREAARETLELLAGRSLGLRLNINMTAADVVRDADLLPLYKRAGVDNVIMGIESIDDPTLERVRKNNPFAVSREAVRLLRAHGIVSLTNVIYGLEEESLRTLWKTLRGAFTLDSDILNACYLTPHSWTPAGRTALPEEVIQPDQARYTYRNQVMRTPNLAPWMLFLTVKLTELVFHARPRAVVRLIATSDRWARRLLRSYFLRGAPVILAEIAEFLFGTRFVPPGALRRVPGFPVPEAVTPAAAGRLIQGMQNEHVHDRAG